MEKRILITGVGRRVELMQAFREAARNLNINLKLIGADMAGTAPALAFCDYYRKVCAMRDPNYILELLQICKDEKIDLILPTIDTDLQVLSDNAAKFLEIGTRVLISASDKIAICRDKNYTSDFFVTCGLKAPKPYNDYREYSGPFPCFIKPKDGSSSINAFKVETAEELPGFAERVEDYIIQPFIEGTEYTADIFCDFDGNPIFITPRIRLAVRSGEVLKTEIVSDSKIIEECRKLIAAYKPCGPITVQLIRQNSTGDDYYIEINPRYGGGAPLSMKAGARSAEALLKLMCGEKVEYSEAVENGAVYSRFDQSVCITPGEKGQQVKGVIFDLDDTLYPERAYVRSGYRAVGKWLSDILAEDMPDWTEEVISEKLWNYFMKYRPAIDDLTEELFDTYFGEKEKDDAAELERRVQTQSENRSVYDDVVKEDNRVIANMRTDDIRKNALKTYREHKPDITLYDGVCDLIKKLTQAGIKVGIITDGRPDGQNNKIDALGIRDYVEDIIVTDELGGIAFRKPCDITFRIMHTRWRIPYEQMVYVGDNPAKDFIAPTQLGMQSVYVHNPEGIYYKGRNDELKKTINSVTELLSVINV